MAVDDVLHHAGGDLRVVPGADAAQHGIEHRDGIERFLDVAAHATGPVELRQDREGDAVFEGERAVGILGHAVARNALLAVDVHVFVKLAGATVDVFASRMNCLAAFTHLADGFGVFFAAERRDIRSTGHVVDLLVNLCCVVLQVVGDERVEIALDNAGRNFLLRPDGIRQRVKRRVFQSSPFASAATHARDEALVRLVLIASHQVFVERRVWLRGLLVTTTDCVPDDESSVGDLFDLLRVHGRFARAGEVQHEHAVEVRLDEEVRDVDEPSSVADVMDEIQQLEKLAEQPCRRLHVDALSLEHECQGKQLTVGGDAGVVAEHQCHATVIGVDDFGDLREERPVIEWGFAFRSCLCVEVSGDLLQDLQLLRFCLEQVVAAGRGDFHQTKLPSGRLGDVQLPVVGCDHRIAVRRGEKLVGTGCTFERTHAP